MPRRLVSRDEAKALARNVNISVEQAWRLLRRFGRNQGDLAAAAAILQKRPTLVSLMVPWERARIAQSSRAVDDSI